MSQYTMKDLLSIVKRATTASQFEGWFVRELASHFESEQKRADDAEAAAKNKILTSDHLIRLDMEETLKSALVAIAGSGICTPVEGYIKSPSCLAANIKDLRRLRDEAQANADHWYREAKRARDHLHDHPPAKDAADLKERAELAEASLKSVHRQVQDLCDDRDDYKLRAKNAETEIRILKRRIGPIGSWDDSMDLGRRLVRTILDNQDRLCERLVEAWIAETGLKPSESVIVSKVTSGNYRTWVEAKPKP